MKSSISFKMYSFTVFFTAFSLIAFAQANTWKTVRAGGCGAVTSMEAHPLVPNLYFMTTDVGTPYIWEHDNQSWRPLFYNLDPKYWGINAAQNMAFDPQDDTGNVLYANLGGDSNMGTIFKSTDRGRTWTDAKIPLYIRPNADQTNGQRLAVDPNNSNVVYVTTRVFNGKATGLPKDTTTTGIFKSTTAGTPQSFIKVSPLCGSFLLFDKSGGVIDGVTKKIYVGCNDGVYLSEDGGTSFNLMPNSPDKVRRGVIHKDGVMYVTTRNGVHKWDGTTWLNISPEPTGTLGYQAVDVNPNNPNQVIVGIRSFDPYLFTIYVSDNGGNTWLRTVPLNDNTEMPFNKIGISEGLADFCWDYFDQNMVWFGDYFSTHQTTNVWAGSNITWKTRIVGHEETVTIGNLISPPFGVNRLLSSTADVGGFDHKSLSAPPQVCMLEFFPWASDGGANMTGAAVQESNPDYIVRIGRHGWALPVHYSGYSTDGGNSYTHFNPPSNSFFSGVAALSATKDIILWSTQGGPTYRSTNKGQSWTEVTTLGHKLIDGWDVFTQGPVHILAADKVNGDKFYAYDPNVGAIFYSTDGGATFTKGASGLQTRWWFSHPMQLETTPGKEGELWLHTWWGGLFHSTDGGITMKKVSGVEKPEMIAIGAASPATPDNPAIYVWGQVSGKDNSLFRSNDNGATWQMISGPTQTGSKLSSIAADRQIYGRVYAGTPGNGIFYFDTEEYNDNQAPTTPINLTASDISSNSALLKWDGATDNIAVASYDIYVNGVYKGSSSIKAYRLTNLQSDLTYSITVAAKDVFGNVSSQSQPLSIQTLPVSVLNLSNTPIRVYPNPAKEVVMIEQIMLGDIITISSVDGKKVYQSAAKGTQTFIDLSTFNRGIYLVSIRNKQSEVVSKLIIE